jgi:hypothetical protein
MDLDFTPGYPIDLRPLAGDPAVAAIPTTGVRR